MEELITAIYRTPIIDNHCHPLLKPSAQAKHSRLAITTEAHGNAMKHVKSSLAHIRGVNQLSSILGCPDSWSSVSAAIDHENSKPGDVWAKRCFEGIDVLLIDDGLDGREDTFDYRWHDRLATQKSKRIVRIEKVVEGIIKKCLKRLVPTDELFGIVLQEFEQSIEDAIDDPEVVGFKSVICYRTGLDVPPRMDQSLVEKEFGNYFADFESGDFKRLDNTIMNPFIVHRTAEIIQRSSGVKKPLQFHTGLGDNDITLTLSSPSHLQEFIRNYPTVPIVLLHASYPWTKEAGYLASVYANAYVDIGEVFPMVSKDGQEKILREILELCPSEKIVWSTDGHWFPETFLLAVVQAREAFEAVLSEYVRNGALKVSQAIKVVEDIFFNTSNKLYDLQLVLTRLQPKLLSKPSKPIDLEILEGLLKNHSRIKFLRLQYVDYTGTSRLRVIPIKRAVGVLSGQADSKDRGLSVGVTKASLGHLQNHALVGGVDGTGEYKLEAIFSSLKAGPTEQFASVQGEFRDEGHKDEILCPRSILRHAVDRAKSFELILLVGFEIEIVFLSQISEAAREGARFGPNPSSLGHAWNSAQPIRKHTNMLVDISERLALAGIDLEQWHAEGATGQFEFVLPPLPPLEAVDTLLHAREIIRTVADSYGVHATLHPKPFPSELGTASHVHISLQPPPDSSEEYYLPFYAGVLKSLPAIIAISYSNPASYERVVAGFWAGGSWITWGTQNRETPLRKVDGSHWEIKCIDGLANPYLVLAAIITAGTHGFEAKERMIWKDCIHDPSTLTGEERDELGIKQKLPTSLKQALEELSGSDILTKRLGEKFIQRYTAVKLAEIELLTTMGEDERRDWLIDRY